MFASICCIIFHALAACRSGPIRSGPGDARYLVVAPDAFHAALQPYIKYKQTDLPTALVSLETVIKQFPGDDDAERLKRFLYEKYKSGGARFVLLVGDADIIPVRYMCLDRVTKEAFNVAFYPSDLYYSDLAKADGAFESWNGVREGFHAGYFGEVHGEANKHDDINFDRIDYQPDIAIGRWPVSTPEQAADVANKSIDYEKDAVLADSAAHRAGFVTIGGWVDCRAYMEKLSAVLAPRYQSTLFFEGKTAPGAAQILAWIQAGGGLLLHAGHGHDNGWEGSIQTGNIKSLHNNGHYPIVMSAGCSTARFATLPPYEPYCDIYGKDHKGSNAGEIFTEPPPSPAIYARGRYNLTGLGESLVRAKDAGAVAYIGCNTGSQPCALSLMEGFALSIAKTREGRARLGDCWADAVKYYYQKERLAQLKPNDDWYPPSIFFQGMKFMLFGDPTLRLPS
ncbi:MAG: hypothetical protein HY286_15430 [Planctomycetes bacterium]|nr:hypothetical protein [Planctomycetota bacterium]